MIGGQHSCQHQNHIKLNCNQTQIRTHHLSASDMESITDIGMAQAKNSIAGTNVFYVRSSQVISRLQVQYLSGFYSQGTNHHMKSSVMLLFRPKNKLQLVLKPA